MTVQAGALVKFVEHRDIHQVRQVLEQVSVEGLSRQSLGPFYIRYTPEKQRTDEEIPKIDTAAQFCKDRSRLCAILGGTEGTGNPGDIFDKTRSSFPMASRV